MKSMYEIIYVSDPMCSWCWGFSPVIKQIRDAYNDKFPVRIIMGGLRPGTTEPMDDEMKKFISHHWKDVGERSGQPFNFELMERDDFVYDTEPPARAVVVARTLNPDISLDFLSDVQHAFYAQNRDTNLWETYASLAEKHDLNVAEFKKMFDSPEMRQKTSNDFQEAQVLQVQGFPSLLFRQGQQVYPISSGWQPFDALDQVLSTLPVVETEQA